MKKLSFIILLTVLVLNLSTTALAQAVHADLTRYSFMTEQYPPYNFQEGRELRGISIDLLEALFQETQIPLTRNNVQLVPWPRGYKKVTDTPHSVLFSMTRTAEREPLFAWVGPIAATKVALIARKDKNIQLASVKDAAQYRIGVIRNDVAEQLLLAGGVPKTSLELVSKSELNISKLNKGRIDLMAYEEVVTSWQIKGMGLNPSDFETVLVLQSADLYYAFHKTTPSEVIEKLQSAVNKLEADGTAVKIREKYLK